MKTCEPSSTHETSTSLQNLDISDKRNFHRKVNMLVKKTKFLEDEILRSPLCVLARSVGALSE